MYIRRYTIPPQMSNPYKQEVYDIARNPDLIYLLSARYLTQFFEYLFWELEDPMLLGKIPAPMDPAEDAAQATSAGISCRDASVHWVR
jgi:hypothetical protein